MSGTQIHRFDAGFVRQDLEAHRDLWQAVWFEQQASGFFEASGFFDRPETGMQQTLYLLVPAEGMDVMLMQLAARWFPKNMAWLDRKGHLLPRQLTAFKQNVLLVRWSA